MKLPFSHTNPDELYERFRLAGEEWAKANGEAERQEEQRKSVYSTLYLHADGKTVAEREAQAYASEVWKTHTDKMVAARELANIARAKLDAMKVWWETARSMESTRRLEMGLR